MSGISSGNGKKKIERSPLKYPIVKSISCLNPKMIATISKLRMGRLLEILNEKGHIAAVTADKAKQQFDGICYKADKEWKNHFADFSQTMRLDDFFVSKNDCHNKEDSFKDIYLVIKMGLIFFARE